MPRIGFLVSHNYDAVLRNAPSFQNEYELLQPYFEREGIELCRVVWTEEGLDLSSYDALIPKAVWDYFDRQIEFVSFLDRAALGKNRFINPEPIVRWNMNKRYLAELQGRGFNVLPLRIHDQHTPVAELNLDLYGSRKLIAKPSVSGGSKDTIVFDGQARDAATPTLTKILQECDLIIQPFFEEVQQGELSFFFFGQKFSHAVLKKPPQGEFRAHRFFGAEMSTYTPSSVEIDEAAHFVTGAPGGCTYARVDVIRVNQRLALVELELIEPYLYIEYAGDPDQAAKRFVQGIKEDLGSDK